MTGGYALKESNLTRADDLEALPLHGWSLISVGAALGLGGGLSTGLVGGLLTATSWFTGSYFHGFALQRDGTILMCLTIPFLLLGAHCLDLLDERSKKERRR